MRPMANHTPPERGAIRWCIGFASRDSLYARAKGDTAESELAALEALVAVKDFSNVTIYEELQRAEAENADLRAKLAKRDEEPSANRIELASYALHLALKAASARLGAFSETRYLESAVRAVVANLKNTQPLQQDAARVSADASKERKDHD